MFSKVPERIHLVMVEKDQFENLLMEEIEKGVARDEAYENVVHDIRKYYPLYKCHKNYHSWYMVQIRRYANRKAERINGKK